ncbi:MAG: hypothetical protein GHCLOJNM_03180 [bacterium]|nr:hypothetical protein [bacterium]
MSVKALELIFDPDIVNGVSEPSTLRVRCNDSGEGEIPASISRREFFGENYVKDGKEACLWWQSLFSTPNASGLCLHELFEWDGASALWFTDILVMYPDFWTFPRLLLAERTLEMAQSGKISAVRILGHEPGLAGVLRANGLEARMVSRPRPSAGLFERMIKGMDSFLAWFVHAPYARNEKSWGSQDTGPETLLYTVAPSEWQIPGDGRHRYLADAIEELLEKQVFRDARPLVVASPPSRAREAEWTEFLRLTLSEKGGVHSLAYISLRTALRAQGWCRGVARRLASWLRGSASTPFCYRGWDFGPIALPAVHRAPREAMRGVLRYEALKSALRKLRPGGILLKDEVYTDGRILCAAARAAGIRTVSLQHGTIYPSHWCYLMDPRAAALSRPTLPDALGVYGDNVKRMLVDWHGVPEEIVSVVGARRFRLLDQATPHRDLARLAVKRAPIILLAGQMHQDMERIYDWSFRLFREFPEIQFVIKPHPRDRKRIPELRRVCGTIANSHYYEGPLQEALPLLSATISGHSTALLESIWKKVPAISVQISGETPADWQIEAGILRIVRTLEEYRAAIRAACEGTFAGPADRAKAEAYLEEFLGYSKCRDPEALAALFNG